MKILHRSSAGCGLALALRRRVVLALLLLHVGGAGAYPPVVRGSVVDELGRPVARAIVRLKSGKTTRAFVATDAAGKYALNVADSLLSNPVEFAALGFETLTLSADSLQRRPDVMLEKAARELEEIIVRPDPFTTKGDTVLFNVDAIRTASDRTIEDVIKRLPGVQVDESGAIKHNNEAINRFYIEGLDLLGGNYTLVSRNLGAADVSTIAVYSNHQPVKALEGKEFSKNSAVEVKLKGRMLLNPHGYLEAGVGKESRNAAWQGRLYAMFVNKYQQTYLNVTGGNFDNTRFSTVGGAGTLPPANTPFNSTFPDSPLGTGSADANRYKRNRQWGACVNIGGKTAADATLSGFIGYSGTKSEWSGYSSTTYLRPGESAVVMSQDGTARQRRHTIAANLKVELNKKSIYLRNQTAATVRFSRNATDLMASPPPDITQSTRTNDISVANRTELTITHGRRTWTLTSDFALRNLPLNLLTARTLPNGDLSVGQSARALTFTNSESTTISWGIGRRSLLGVALHFNADYTHLGSEAFGPEADALTIDPRNTTRGSSEALMVGPYYRYTRGVAEWQVDVPLQLSLFNYRNIRSATNDSFSDFTTAVSPSTRLILRFPNRLTAMLSAAHTTSYGSIRNFILAPVFTSYNSWVNYGAGTLGRNRSWIAKLSLTLSKPQHAFSAYFDAIGNITTSGLMTESSVAPTQTGSAIVSRENTSRQLQANFKADKFVSALLSTFRLNSSFAITGTPTLRDGVAATSVYTFWTIGLSANTPIGTFLVAEPAVSYSRTTNSVRGYALDSSAFDAITASLSLSAFAFHRKLELKAQPEYSRQGLAGGGALRNFFLDASVRWVEKKWEVEVRGRNLTNRRTAGYSSINDLNVFTAITALRGAEALATFTWRF